MIYTRKIQLNIIAANPEEKKEKWKKLYNISNQNRSAANTAMTFQHFQSELVKEGVNQKLEGVKRKKAYQDKSKELQKIIGTSLQNKTYQIISDRFPDLPSDIRANLNQKVVKKYVEDKVAILKGEKSISSYKEGLPIPFSAKSMRNFTAMDDTYIFDWFKGIQFSMYFGRDRSGNKKLLENALTDTKKRAAISAPLLAQKKAQIDLLDKVKDKESIKILNRQATAQIKEECKGLIKMSASSIQIKKGKIFLLLCLDIPSKPIALNPDIMVGVNMGLIVPAYVAIPGHKARKAIGSYEELLKPRLRMQKQRSELQKNLKYGIKSGKGRRNYDKKIENLKSREKNYVKTVNHNISKAIISFAIKNNAGTIVLEDLKGFDASDFCLRNWNYFQLQDFVQFKAKRVGITTLFIKPYNHSKTCSICKKEGEVNLKFRTFKCSDKDCKNHIKPIHVDYNAALNAAINILSHSDKG